MVLKVRTDLPPIKDPPPPLSEESVADLFDQIRVGFGLPPRPRLPEDEERYRRDRREYNAKDFSTLNPRD